MGKTLKLKSKIKPLTDAEKQRLIDWIQNYFKEKCNDN